MKFSKNLIKKLTFFLGIVTLFTVIYLNLNKPEPVNAACGVATSSCLTCHEELGKNPVNTKGDWHIQHQFGDFCQACHQGNPNEEDMTKAHEGIIKNPLTAPDQNCQSCHSADFSAKAAKYGSAGTQTSNPGSNSASQPNSDSQANSTSANQPQSALGNGILIAINFVALIVFVVLFQRWRKLRK